MPARRRSSKSVAVTSVKTSSSAKSPLIIEEVVTKYTKPRQIKTVTETPTKARRFATTRPEKPNISLEEYVTDFKLRMQINNYEVMEFLVDCKNFYNTTSPKVVQFYNFVKEKVQSFNVEPAEDKKEES